MIRFKKCALFLMHGLLIALALPQIASADGDYDEDDAGGATGYTPLEYQCSTGKKVFTTKVTKHGPSGHYDKGTSISALIRVEKEKMPVKLKLDVEGETFEGDGDVSWNPSQRQEGGYPTLAKAFDTKLKASQEDPLQLKADLEIKSGSCVAHIAMTAEAPRVLAEEIVTTESREQRAKEVSAKCLAEVNKPAVRASYVSGYLCLLNQCDAESVKLHQQEQAKANHTGYVNKVVMYGIGSYQVASKKERASTIATLKALGAATSCKVPTSHVSTTFFINVQGSYLCMGNILAADIAKGECFAKMFSEGENAKVGYYGGQADRMKTVAQKGFSPEPSNNRFANRQENNDEESVDQSNLDPDIILARKKLAKIKKDAKWTLNETVAPGQSEVTIDPAMIKRRAELERKWDDAKRSQRTPEMLKVGRQLYKISGPKREAGLVIPLALALIDDKNPDEAMQILNVEKYTGDSESNRLRLTLVGAYVADKREDATAAAEGLASLNAETVKDVLLPSEVALQFKDYATAEKLARAVQAKFPTLVEPNLTIARCLYESGKPKDGIALLRKLIDDNENSASARNALAYMLAKEKTDLKEAQRNAEKALDLAKEPREQANIRATLGFVLLQRDESKEALENLQAAYKVTPGEVDVVRDLAKAYIANGKKSEAAKVYQLAAEQAMVPKKERAALLKEAAALGARMPASVPKSEPVSDDEESSDN